MPKTFYTERDIQDLYNSGVTSLVVNDDVVVTDLAREKALKLGFQLVREHDLPDSAPVRPYIVKQLAPKKTAPLGVPPSQSEMEQRVLQSVKARVGDTVDAQLLETIVKRVLQSVGVK